jgi:hypothetical protein
MIKNRFFIAFLILSFASNNHTMEPIEEPMSKELTWQDYIAYIGDVLLGDAELITDESSPLAQLPLEIKSKVVSFLITENVTNNLKSCGKTINSLAQLTSKLNKLINNPDFCLKLIKNLAQRFNCSDQKAAEALQTEEAKRRLQIQKKFLAMCRDMDKTRFDHYFNSLYTEYQEYVDLNFTYYLRGFEQSLPTNLLIVSIVTDDITKSRAKTNYLLNTHAINVNNEGYGISPLTFAIQIQNLSIMQLLCNYPTININQKNKSSGDTPLITTIVDNNTNLEFKLNGVQLLLNAGADPELANSNGLTPLQAAKESGDQEIIDLIQNAIDNKHGKK